MVVKILGKYGPYPKEGCGTSSYLVMGKNTSIVVDLGEGSLSKLKGQIKPQELSAIILTHFHFDHACDMGVMGYYLDFKTKSCQFSGKMKVLCPKDNGDYSKSLKNISVFDFEEVQERSSYSVGEFKLSFYEMKHPVKTFGVRITDGHKTVAFSGDTNICDNLDSLIKGVDLAVLDGGFLYRDWAENKPHLSIRHIGEIAKKHKVKTIISHIYPEYTEGEINQEVSLYVDYCTIAEEGQSIEV